MSKKLYLMISAIVTAVGAIATAVVTYAVSSNAGLINGAIVIAVTAINDILFKFVKDEPVKVEEKKPEKTEKVEEKKAEKVEEKNK